LLFTGGVLRKDRPGFFCVIWWERAAENNIVIRKKYYFPCT